MDDNPGSDAMEALTELLYILPVGLIQFRTDGAIELVNPLAAQLLVPISPAGDLLDAYSALGPLMPDLARQVRAFAAPHGLICDHVRCEVMVNGELKVLSLTVHRLHGLRALAMLEDVTALAKHEQRLEVDRQRFLAIFEHVRDYAICTTDQCGRIDEWNQSLHRLGGWKASDVIGQPVSIFLPEDLPVAESTVLDRARSAGSCETEGWRLCPDGSRIWANTVLTALPDAAGAVRGFVAVTRDMTERKRTEDELRRLATTDPLTGAFNRRFGHSLLQAQREAQAVGGRPFSVLMLDIDHFKSINDSHGHDIGDVALCATVAACREVLGGDSAIVRWGGEEFLVVLPGQNIAEAVATAEAIRAAIAALVVPAGAAALRLTASLGVSNYQSDGVDGLIHRADAALYQAKRQGRNRVAAATEAGAG